MPKQKSTRQKLPALPRVPAAEALNPTQGHFLAQYAQRNIHALLGWAGTGKTHIAVSRALQDLFDPQSGVRQLVLLRNIVNVRDPGHMPGDEREKFGHYEKVFRQMVNDLCGRGDAYELLTKAGKLLFTTTTFLQGVTLDDSVIVADECQNLNFPELDLITTRIGQGSKLILCGDRVQDYVTDHRDRSGLDDWLAVMAKRNALQAAEGRPSTFIRYEFDVDEIVRDDEVRDYIIARESVLGGAT